MDDFKPTPHPVGLDNLTATVESVERVEVQDKGTVVETVLVQLHTVTIPEGYSVPVTLMIDADDFARLLNLSLRKS